jgi:acetyl-CoA synthetase
MSKAGAAVAAWEAAARGLTWDQPWDVAYEPDPDNGPGRWFVGGQLNAAVNCLDRHLPAHADRVAIHWEGEPGDRRTLTYGRLHREVVRTASALRDLGVRPGDRVALHLGWLPETVVAMLASARLGAVHVVLPAPLPPDALADRLAALRSKVLITQDGAWRHGVVLPLKARADEALAAGAGVEHTIVVRRTGVDVPWYEGDRWWHDVVAGRAQAKPAASLAADHPLFAAALATRRSHATTVIYGTGGLLTYAATMHGQGWGPEPNEVFWSASDISWPASQVHGVYGPLACAATTVMFEGMLDIPSRARAWEIIDRYQVRRLLTTPTVVRRLRTWAQESGRQPDSRLRAIITAGEPIEPALRSWLADIVGKTAVFDAWGQIELGGIVTFDPPPPTALPDPGLDIVQPDGSPTPDGNRGELVLRHPWAGTLVAFDGADEAERELRWGRYPGAYATRDWARRRPDGGLEIVGRMDEVVSVSGQLVSLRAVCEVLLDHPFVSSADVIERRDSVAGRVLTACVVPAAGQGASEKLARELRATVRDTLGGLAQPRIVAFVEAFPHDIAPDARREALRALCNVAPGEVLLITVQRLRSAADAHAGEAPRVLSP